METGGGGSHSRTKLNTYMSNAPKDKRFPETQRLKEFSFPICIHKLFCTPITDIDPIYQTNPRPPADMRDTPGTHGSRRAIRYELGTSLRLQSTLTKQAP